MADVSFSFKYNHWFICFIQIKYTIAHDKKKTKIVDTEDTFCKSKFSCSLASLNLTKILNSSSHYDQGKFYAFAYNLVITLSPKHRARKINFSNVIRSSKQLYKNSE